MDHRAPQLGPVYVLEDVRAARTIAELARFAVAVRSTAPRIEWIVLNCFRDLHRKAHVDVSYETPLDSLIDNDAFAAAAWRLENAILDRRIEIGRLEDVFDIEDWRIWFGDKLILLKTAGVRDHRYVETWEPLVLDPSAHARLEAEVLTARIEMPQELRGVRCSKLLW